jgi:hypothetical protein
MPIAPSPLPDDLSFAVFSTQEAHRVGVTRGRLRASDLTPLSRGLWSRDGRVVTEREIVGALCRRDPAVFAMGLTAGRLLGFPLPGIFEEQVIAAPRQSRPSGRRRTRSSGRRDVDRRIHLGTTKSRRRETALVRWSVVTPGAATAGSPAPELRTEGALAREVLTPELVTLPEAPAVRSTSRIRTFLDLGNILALDALVAIGDHLVRSPRPRYEEQDAPFATIDELTAAVSRHRGRGTRRLQEAVALVRTSSDSPPETALRLAIVRAGLPEPLANARAEQVRSDGTVLDLGEPDLHWPRWRVAVEHEGPTHLDRDQVPKDITRGERRRDAGWVEIRTTFADLPHDCRSAVVRIRSALEQQGWRAE